jgi:hypothetical protein
MQRARVDALRHSTTAITIDATATAQGTTATTVPVTR